MESLMERWYNAAGRRISVREYSHSLNKELFSELKDFAADISNGEARLVLLSKSNVLKPMLFRGGVSGTKCFAAVIAKKGSRYMGGYIGEAFVLECTAMGLGTCWLGASYKKSTVKQYINLSPEETLVCIIAVGEYNRSGSKSRKHKSLEQITCMSRDEFNELPTWQQDAVRCARIAPSAMNKQPWELEFENDNMFVVNISNNFGYGEVDCGIAMLHIELGAAHNGVCGDWELESGTPKFIPVNI
ncbi:MAG: nitroreductase family protein [Christensenellaceae bacterium]|nr:nitroreductase family protein [Christensenellaceae bacterium]